jgi:hypothetical protein
MATAPAAALADGDAAAREAAYCEIDDAVRRNRGTGGDTQARVAAVALAASCAPPLIALLSSDVSVVAEPEFRRAGLLLYEMIALDPTSLWRASFRASEPRCSLCDLWRAKGSAFAAVLAKESWTKEDAITAAIGGDLGTVALWVTGATNVIEGTEISEQTFLQDFMGCQPWLASAGTRYIPLILLVLDLLRGGTDLPEGLISNACALMTYMGYANPAVAQALLEAGFLNVMESTLKNYSPMERISPQQIVPAAVLCALQ